MKKDTKFKKGVTPWNKGIKGSIKPNSGSFKKGEHLNEAHFLWKGDRASYTAIHQWMRRHFGEPKRCEKCKTTKAKRFEWANISGKYLRGRADWIRLCTTCHHRMDDITNRGWITRKKKLCFA